MSLRTGAMAKVPIAAVDRGYPGLIGTEGSLTAERVLFETVSDIIGDGVNALIKRQVYNESKRRRH